MNLLSPREWEAAFSQASPEELHGLLKQRGEYLRDEFGETRRDRADKALMLYNASWRYSFSETYSDTWLDELRPVAYNLIQAAVDTKTNHILRNKVRPLFVTEKGDSALQEKAKGMQRAVEALLHSSGMWGDLGARVCKAGQMFEGGGVYLYADYPNHRVQVERVNAHDWHTDPEESRNGDPRRAWLCRSQPRELLEARFSDDDDALEVIRETKAAISETAGQTSISDMVEVWEYWHLPSGYVDRSDPAAWGVDEEGNAAPASHDGRHVVYTESGVLLDEVYPYPYFPVSWFLPMRADVGIWSTSIPERLAHCQIKINELNERVDAIIKAHAVPRFFIDKRAKINTTKINNDHAAIYEVDGSPTQAVHLMVPQAVPPELIQRADAIIRWSEKQIGLSEMSIAAMKPKGVDHAPGMQHLADTESIRHTESFRAWEDFFVRFAHIAVDCFRQLAERDDDFEIVFSDSKQLLRIKWTDVDMEESRYHLRCWPTNLLPQTPAARMSKAMDLFNAGLITREQVSMLLDFPDLEAVIGDQTAAVENIERMIDDVRAGEEVIPTPYVALDLARVHVVNAINRAEADRADSKVIERLQDFFQLIEDMIQRQQMAAAQVEAVAAGAAPMPAPAGPPMPPMPPAGPVGPPMN